ncbi:Auxin transport protein BIG [Pelomyxa schiedti]|nr:Auxin transport protein BIG [Pelomyxa schiedti]
MSSSSSDPWSDFRGNLFGPGGSPPPGFPPIPASSSNTGVHNRINTLAFLYAKECKSSFDSLRKSVQVLTATKRELVHYNAKKEGKPVSDADSTSVRGSGRCFGCSNTFVGLSLRLLEAMAKNEQSRKSLVDQGMLQLLMQNNVRNGSEASRKAARRLICVLINGCNTATSQLVSMIKERLCFALDNYTTMDPGFLVRNEMALLYDVCKSSEGQCWEQCFRLVFEMLLMSTERGSTSPLVCEHIILPCLHILTETLGAKEPTADEKKSKPTSTSTSTSTSASASTSTSTPPSNKLAHLRPTPTEPVDMVVDSTPQPSQPQQPQTPEPSATVLPVFQGSSVSLTDWTSKKTSYDAWLHSLQQWSQAHAQTKTLTKEEAREFYIMEKYYSKWTNYILHKRTHPMSPLEELQTEGSWIQKLLLCPCSDQIRLQAAALVRILYQHPVRALKFLDMFTRLLPSAIAMGEASSQFFVLFNALLEPWEHRVYFVVKKNLPYLVGLILAEIERIHKLEAEISTDITQGTICHTLVSILSRILEEPVLHKKFKSMGFVHQLLDGFLMLRGLIVQKTKLTDDSSACLMKILLSMNQSEEEQREFMHACVKGLDKYKDWRIVLFIYEQLGKIICPEKPEVEFQLDLKKASSQDEFIRGSMTKNPYSSKEVGPLMRDVKNKICTTLDLRGLIDDDLGMELLVCNKIIKLDLPIKAIYEQVWLPSVPEGKKKDVMQVIYRLQGLDGEATEAIVDTIRTDSGEQKNPEEEFRITAVMAQCGGLNAMLRTIQRAPELEQIDLLQLVLKLLRLALYLQVNRQNFVLLDGPYIIAEKLKRVLSLNSDALNNIAIALSAIIEAVGETIDLPISGPLPPSITTPSSPIPPHLPVESKVSTPIQEPVATSSVSLSSTSASATPALSPTPTSTPTPTTSTSASTSTPTQLPEMDVDTVGMADKQQARLVQLEGLLALLTQCMQLRKNSALLESVLKVFPLLTYNNPTLMDRIIAFFGAYTDFDAYNAQEASDGDKVTFGLNCFISMVSSINMKTQSGPHLKSRFIEKSVTAFFVNYIRSHFPADKDKSSPEWTRSLSERSLPVVLQILSGLAKQHPPTQEMHADILPVIHTLEQVKIEEVKKVGLLAANLLDTLKDNPVITKAVESIRIAARKEKMKLAEQRRQQILKEMKLEAHGSKIVAAGMPSSVEELGEEDRLRCTVCKEGFTYKPQEVLGFYVFCKPTPMASIIQKGLTPNRADAGVSTATHFNLIHFTCHEHSTRAERKKKAPKEEWEGAALRNQFNKCNNIFPIMGPSTTDDGYTACAERFWNGLSLKRSEQRLRVLIHDMRMLITRVINKNQSDPTSGGREANTIALPFMFQMANFLLEKEPGYLKSFQASLSSFVSQSRDLWDSNNSQCENVLYFLVLSLPLMPLEEWQTAKITFIKRILSYAHYEMSVTEPVKPKTEPEPRPKTPPPQTSSARPKTPPPATTTATASASSTDSVPPPTSHPTEIPPPAPIEKPAPTPVTSAEAGPTATATTASATLTPVSSTPAKSTEPVAIPPPSVSPPPTSTTNTTSSVAIPPPPDPATSTTSTTASTTTSATTSTSSSTQPDVAMENATTVGDKSFSACRAHLMFMCFIDAVHRAVKTKSGLPGSTLPDVVYRRDDPWVAYMKSELRKKTITEKMQKLLKDFDDEVAPCSEFMEVFDTLGILEQVLRESPAFEEFVSTYFH